MEFFSFIVASTFALKMKCFATHLQEHIEESFVNMLTGFALSNFLQPVDHALQYL